MDRINGRLSQQATSSKLLQVGAERAVIVGAEVRLSVGTNGVGRREGKVLSLEDSLAELALLTNTAGADVVGMLVQRLNRPNAATYIGPGKVDELDELMVVQQADLAIFDVNLSPTQQRNLGERLRRRIVDRTALILDIFAQRANTSEGKLQVELAQLEYLRPRLSQIWEEWSRLGGAGAGGSGRIATRGPGETQLETDRRSIHRRLSILKKKIGSISSQRGLYRSRRKADGPPIVALVGYTNAGKSSLLEALTNVKLLREDKLFATLDPKTRRLQLPSGQTILLTDTVGFIQRLPTNLVAAFRATLEEVDEADLLIHVVDGAHGNVREQISSVGQTLNDLRVSAKPMVTAVNKLDLVPSNDSLVLESLPNPVRVSATRGDGLLQLLGIVEEIIAVQVQIKIRVCIPYRLGRLVHVFHTAGTVGHEQYDVEGTVITGTIPERLKATFLPYRV